VRRRRRHSAHVQGALAPCVPELVAGADALDVGHTDPAAGPRGDRAEQPAPALVVPGPVAEVPETGRAAPDPEAGVGIVGALVGHVRDAAAVRRERDILAGRRQASRGSIRARQRAAAAGRAGRWRVRHASEDDASCSPWLRVPVMRGRAARHPPREDREESSPGGRRAWCGFAVRRTSSRARAQRTLGRDSAGGVGRGAGRCGDGVSRRRTTADARGRCWPAGAARVRPLESKEARHDAQPPRVGPQVRSSVVDGCAGSRGCRPGA